MNLYPLSQADNPPVPAGVVAVGEKEIDTDWPKDYAAWKLIHEGMQLDNIRKQDKIIYDFLRELGIEHGKPFNPDRPSANKRAKFQVGFTPTTSLWRNEPENAINSPVFAFEDSSNKRDKTRLR